MCTPKSLSRNASYALIPLDSSCSESSDLLPSPPQHGAGRRNEHAPPPRKVCEAAQAVQRRDDAARGAPSFRFESGTLFVRAGSGPEGGTHDGVTPERSMALSQAAPTSGLLASSSASAAYGGLAAALACKGVAFAFDASKILMCFTTIGSMYDMYATGMGVVDAHKQHVHCMKMRVDCIKILTDAQQRLARNEDPDAQRMLISAAREVLGLLHGLSASFEKLYVHKDVAAVWATRRELQRMLVDTDTAIAELMLTSDSLEADNGLVRQALGDALQTASILRDTLEAMPKARLHGKGPWQRWRVGHSEWVRLVPLVKRLRARQEAQEEKDSAARECDPQHKSNPTFAQVLTLLKGLQTRTDKLGGNDPLGGIGQHEAKFWRDVHLAGAQPLLLLSAHASLLAQAPGALTGVAGLLLPMAVLQGMLDLKDVKRQIVSEFGSGGLPSTDLLTIPEYDNVAPEEDWTSGLPVVLRGIQTGNWDEVAHGIIISLEQVENYPKQSAREDDPVKEWRDRNRRIAEAEEKVTDKWMPADLMEIAKRASKN